MDNLLKPLHGKALSYNNLFDVDAAVQLMEEFTHDSPHVCHPQAQQRVRLCHTSPLAEAYADALAGDPTSAFGGVLIANRTIDLETANLIHEFFCEVVIAPGFEEDAFAVLSQKKNRILLERQAGSLPKATVRSALNGYLVQERDNGMEQPDNWTCTTDVSHPPRKRRTCCLR